MKLSNKILIGFFGLIFIYMAAAFTEVRFSGELNRIDDSIGMTEKVDITGVSYLILPELEESVTIRGTLGKPRIEVRSLTGDMLQHLTYKISGDTLSLLALDLVENKPVNLFIYISESGLTSLTANSAGVIIEELKQQSLNIYQKDGWLRMDATNELNNLYIEASNGAYFNLDGINLDTLSVNIDSSNMYIRSTVNHVKGTLYNDAYLQLGEVNEIVFKKDTTSVLHLY